MRGEIPARVLARLDVAGLPAGGEEDEYGHQHQQRIAHQSEKPEEHRQPLPDRGCDARGARIAHPDRQQGPQHAAAIHGKRRDQVEDEEHHVGGGDPAGQGRLRLLELGHLRQVEAGSQHDDQHQRDDEVDGGTGQRHHDLLAGLFRHALQRGDAADRQQRDIGGADAVAAGGKHMAELVQHDAQEQGDDEHDPVDRRRRAALGPVDGGDPRQQQKERDVDAHGGAGDIEQPKGPTHSQAPPRARPSTPGQGSMVCHGSQWPRRRAH